MAYAQLREHGNSRYGSKVSTATGRTAAVASAGPVCVEDVLERYAATAFLDMELKDFGLDGMVHAALCQRPPQRGYVVSSFLPQVIRALRMRDPSMPLGWICNQRRQLERWPMLPIEFVIPHRSLVSRRLVEELHAAGKRVFVWTVNSRRAMVQLAEWEVDAIISDDTELLGRTFAGC